LNCSSHEAFKWVVDTDTRGASEWTADRAEGSVISIDAFNYASNTSARLAKDWSGNWADDLRFASGKVACAGSVWASQWRVDWARRKDFAKAWITRAGTVSAEEWSAVAASDTW
jgi:hypothetical protein